jgi:catechol 2,3-dioxygenase-like lactoylglutathione lyase family enzyme
MPNKSLAKLPVISFHVVIYSKKWKECVSFYRDILGFPVIFSNNIFVELEAAPGSRIGLLDATRTRRSPGNYDNFILSFCVSDVEETRELLQVRYPELSQVKQHPWGAKVFELKDPEGRRLEFWSASS